MFSCYRYEKRRALFEAKQKQPEVNKKFIETVAPVETSKFISAVDLYRQLEKSDGKILLIDCRSKDDFNASKIKYNNLINIPGEMIVKG